MGLKTVCDAYGSRAGEYVAALGNMDQVADLDVALVESWARGISGPMLDVGCGPGHWTHHLTTLGLDVEGIDPVAEFIRSARTRYPRARYRLGRAEALDVKDHSLGGVLAWYSLIHLHPAQMQDVISEFARGLRPGGGLAVGFFTGPTLEVFEHAITPACYWPIALLAEKLRATGFDVTHAEQRRDPGARDHGAILATFRGPAQASGERDN